MKDFEVRDLEKKCDERGWLVEVLGSEFVGKHSARFGQIHVSVARPGKVRGNHYHTRKVEWFCVPSGTGTLVLKDVETGEEQALLMGENNLRTVQINPGILHAIKNTGDTNLVLIVYSSESFDPEDPDTYYRELLK